MHILLAPAKTMIAGVPMPDGVSFSLPHFRRRAAMLASEMGRYTPAELASMLKISLRLAAGAYRWYKDFPVAETLRPAALSYDGIAFKYLGFGSLSPGDMEWANRRLTICSFLYGMLRPLDLINPYRLEGKVILPATDPATVIESWRPLLTDRLIEDVRADGGLLLNLASDEMKGFFDWKRVTAEVRVVTAAFKLGEPGRLRTSSVYAKMCRGAMARYVIANRLNDLSRLASWDFNGFRLIDSTDTSMTFAAQL